MAMDFLRDEKDIKINEIDASGSIQEVAEAILAELYNISPSIAPQQSTKNPSFSSESRTILGDTLSYRTEDAIADLEVLELFKKADRPVGKTGSEDSSAGFISQKTILDQLETQIKAMSLDQLGGLFLGYIEERDYIVRGKLSGTELEAYEIEYTLPEGLLLRGVALIIPEEQRYDDILKLAPNIPKMSDFMFVFCPGPPELVTKHYERTPIKYKADSVQEGLFPSTKLISQKDLAKNMEHAARNISKTQLL